MRNRRVRCLLQMHLSLFRPGPQPLAAAEGIRAADLESIDRHSGQLDELDVEGILAFAERVLPRAADLWVQASLEQRQRFQQLSFQTESRLTEKALLEPA